jgi:hypothetical protein
MVSSLLSPPRFKLSITGFTITTGGSTGGKGSSFEHANSDIAKAEISITLRGQYSSFIGN